MMEKSTIKEHEERKFQKALNELIIGQKIVKVEGTKRMFWGPSTVEKIYLENGCIVEFDGGADEAYICSIEDKDGNQMGFWG